MSPHDVVLLAVHDLKATLRSKTIGISEADIQDVTLWQYPSASNLPCHGMPA